MSVATLNKVKYSGFDFDTLNDELRARLQVKFASDFNDFAVSSLGIMLLDLTAFGLDSLSFYLDRRASDTFLSTARTRASVSRGSRQLGYSMGGAVASSTDLDVRTDEVYAFDVPIIKGFQFKGPNDTIFEAAEDVVFTPAEQGLDVAPKSIPVYEGATIGESFTSDGLPNQVFNLSRVPDDKYVVQGAVTVKVNGADFFESELLEYGETDQFEVGYNDDPPTIRFGDGISGNIPTAAATIDVTYVASFGKVGQVQHDTITDPQSPLVVMFQTIPLTITNPGPSVGGDDPESLSRAKAFAPKVWKTRKVAITGPDYEALAGSFADPLFGRVAVAKAIASRSAATDLTLQNLLTDIYNAIATFDSDINTEVGNINSALADYDIAYALLEPTPAAIQAQESTINTGVTNIKDASTTSKEDLVVIGTSKSRIDTHVFDGKTYVGTLSALSPTEKSNVYEYFDLITGEATVIGNEKTSVDGKLDDIKDVYAVAIDEAVNDTGGIAEITVSQAVYIADIHTAVDTDIRNANDAIAALNTDVQDQISTAGNAIYDHVDAMLSSDCRVNLVTVPILTRDAGGFYIAPSNGLIQSLQTYLDARKEVTQTVSVTSGENFLIPAAIRIHLGVEADYSEQAIKKAVETAVDGILRDRSFGKALYETDIDKMAEAVEGVRFATIIIDGYVQESPTGERSVYWDASAGAWKYSISTDTASIDGTKVINRNLVILESEVITKGGIYISTEIVVE